MNGDIDDDLEECRQSGLTVFDVTFLPWPLDLTLPRETAERNGTPSANAPKIRMTRIAK